MGFSCSEEAGVLTLVHRGDYAADETWSLWKEVLNAAEDATAVMVDLRESTAVHSSDELRVLARRICARNSCVCRIAIVVRDPLRFGLARMFGAYCGGCIEVEVFQSRETARAATWLSELTSC